jgi:hypothetical protein
MAPNNFRWAGEWRPVWEWAAQSFDLCDFRFTKNYSSVLETLDWNLMRARVTAATETWMAARAPTRITVSETQARQGRGQLFWLCQYSLHELTQF